MNSKTTKTNRLVPVALLAIALALIVGVVGFMMPVPSAKAEDAAPVTAWEVTPGSKTLVEQPGLVKVPGDAVVVNSTNILSLPNRTAYFQMKISMAQEWAGMGFLNGMTGWQSFNWPGTGANKDTTDTHAHLIFQGGTTSSQIYSGTAGVLARDLGVEAPHGVSGMAQFENALVGVEIHIGDGASDKSYIKMNNTMLLDATTNESAIAYIKSGDFQNGCYFAIHLNMNKASDMMSYFGEYGTPIPTAVDSSLNSVIDYTATVQLDADASFTVRNLSTPTNAVLKINGVEVDSQYYEAASVAGDDKALTYIVKKEFWATKVGALTRESYFTVEDANGKAVVLLQVQNAPPPVWTSATVKPDPKTEIAYKELSALQDVEFNFTYTASITAETITVRDGVSPATLGSQALVPGTDYELRDNENNGYVLVFKQAYLEKVIGTYNGRCFRIDVGEDYLIAQIYVAPETEGWYARKGVDVDDDLSVDEYYASGTLKKHSGSALSSRLYYNKGVDVTKPIIIEFSDLWTDTEQWLLFQVADSRRTMDYFSNETSTDAVLQALFFGGRRYNLQQYKGISGTEGSITGYTPAGMHCNVLELYFGEEAKDSYMKVNGDSMGTVAAKQSDFADGKAYIGWFSAYSGDAFDFKVNVSTNPVVVTTPYNADAYKMDLGAATDFTVTLANYAATDTIQVKSGETALAAGTDYTFNAETGALTIKTAYFESIPFSKEGVISVWNDTAKTGTQFRLTYSSSNMKASQIAFATKGNVQNATFTMPEGVTVNMLLDGDSEEVNTTNWDFANGKLTVHKEVIGDKYGATEFIAVAGKDLYPLYVYVQDFKDGGLKESGEGSIVAGNGAYLINSDVSYMFEKAYNLTNGLTAKVDFKEIPGYYGGGINYTKTGYVQFAFYDPYSNSTFKFRLYTNTPDSEVSPSETALYGAYEMTGGNTIPLNPAMINVAGENSQNNSALGVHGVTFSVNDKGALVIKVDNAREITVSAANLGTFNLSASILTVSTPASQGDDKMALGLQLTDGVAEIDYTAITVTNDEKKPGNTGCGCGSEMVGASTVLGAVLVLIAALVLVRRKKATDK